MILGYLSFVTKDLRGQTVRSTDKVADATAHVRHTAGTVFQVQFLQLELFEDYFLLTMADSSDISSSDSDEEFLTVTDDRKVDREALVRKKLLENFYGKSAVAAAAPSSGLETDDDDEDDNEDIASAQKSSEDLDSPSFNSSAFLERRIKNSSVHDLLENEEQLALQVRTLDSTMQTLVYENYSRFIDATDAIRSIGVNVEANEEGLTRLMTGMQAMEDRSRAIEDAVGTLRDQVAEKIRVKRLLTRLDTLLKLPQTLRNQIDGGKYRTATKGYLSAAAILGKHSAGFESLRTIETECRAILLEMQSELDQKLLHWSGRSSMESETVPDPPKTMTEIFECVGTLLMLLQNEHSPQNSVDDEVERETKIEDFRSMATAAALRLLDRTLDAHMIEVQELRYPTTGLDAVTLDMKLEAMESIPVEPKSSALVAKGFLNVLLEGATLFSMTFPPGESTSTHLAEFVSEGFSSFLYHMKTVLLEETSLLNKNASSGEEVDENPQGYQDIANALSILVQSVRELASALPEVGISGSYAEKLVDRATELTESMVRRRVDQQFHTLRLSVVEECLVPFATRVADETSTGVLGEDGMAAVLQFANSTLSDCLQLVDDTIRGILAGGLEVGDGPAPDLPDLKDAVQASTKRFAFWLADTLELLAGGESSDRSRVLEAAPASEDEVTGELDLDKGESISVASDLPSREDDLENISGQAYSLLEKLDGAIRSLMANDDFVQTEFVLALAEMCRMAEGSVAENLEQSIATHLGGSKKKSRGLFPSGEASPSKKAQGSEDDITRRFQLARSSVLVIYSSNRGAQAANTLCSPMEEVAHKTDGEGSDQPSESAWKVLEIAKNASLEFSIVFGGNKRAGPVPELDSSRLSGMSTALTGRKTGLQLDVERMFKEKIQIYPHPSVILEPSRNAVVFLLFKIAFRAMLEQSRFLHFSGFAYRQFFLDVEFLKHMVAHYIDGEYSPGGSTACTGLQNLLDECMDVIGDRCLDSSVLDVKEELSMHAVSGIRSFLKSAAASNLSTAFIIDED